MAPLCGIKKHNKLLTKKFKRTVKSPSVLKNKICFYTARFLRLKAAFLKRFPTPLKILQISLCVLYYTPQC